MVRKQPVDVTTVRRPPAGGDVAEQPLLALTVLVHPDAERIGDVAFLESRARLSRLEPELGPTRRGEGGGMRPLSDPHLSRRPIAIETDAAGGVTLAPPPSGTDVVVDGVRLTGPRALSAAQVEHGAVIELGERVALLLHRRRAPLAGGPDHGLVGHSEAMDRLRAEIDRVADLDAPVLLGGETGTGKELVARAIHAGSGRAQGPFVAVNVAAIPAAMAASQLFGHARGAFTGAAGEHEGFFARADRGTLFLDEVGEMAAEVQPVLLRALDDGEVWPLGAAASRRVDVRVIAATDADLTRRAADGQFKAPLLHRLAGYVIRLPPLAERRDDIARLLVHFLRAELAAAGEPDWLGPGREVEHPWLDADAMAALVRRDWPGNVRELRNAARRIVIGSRGASRARVEGARGEAGGGEAARADEIGEAVAAGPAAAGRGRAEISAEVLIDALRRHGWKTGDAAAALGVSKTTLYALMERTPGVRKARELSAEEISAAEAAAGGEVDRMAEALRVSRRGLVLRMRELGLEGGRGRG
ncbi:MAG TPA: sigma 54-interacting transcriptional regulator [Kofleriaceae bacterium]|nr:sigma 54-interacting transcriptional regulator [Kofleriaceae bacterium]